MKSYHYRCPRPPTCRHPPSHPSFSMTIVMVIFTVSLTRLFTFYYCYYHYDHHHYAVVAVAPVVVFVVIISNIIVVIMIVVIVTVMSSLPKQTTPVPLTDDMDGQGGVGGTRRQECGTFVDVHVVWSLYLQLVITGVWHYPVHIHRLQ